MRQVGLKKTVGIVLAAVLFSGLQPALAGQVYAAAADLAAGVQPLTSPEAASDVVSRSWEEDFYYSEVKIRTDTGKVYRDGQTTDLQEIFHVSERWAAEWKKGNAAEKNRTLVKYLKKNGAYEFQKKKNMILVQSPYQLKRVIVHIKDGSPLKETCGAQKVCFDTQMQDYVLEYSTPAETKRAFEKLEKIFGSGQVAVDQLVTLCGDNAGEQTDAGNGVTEQAPSQNTAAGQTQSGKGETDSQTSSGNQTVSSDPSSAQPQYVSWGTHFMGLDSIRDAANQDPEITGEVRVAVLDSGAYGFHEMLRNRIDKKNSRNFLNCWNTGKKPSGKWMDDSALRGTLGHGTHVSGIIADGTSNQVKLLELKVVDHNGKGSLYDIGLAIRYAMKKNAKVMNISAGVALYSWYRHNSQYRFLEPILKKAWKKGIFICCAVGNDHENLKVLHTYPATSKYVTGVGAMNQNSKAAAFSNYGKSLDFLAPGVNIKSANRFATNDYILSSGTSMASPHITAAAAMICLYNPQGNAKTVRSVLRRQSAVGAKGKKGSYYGYGYVRMASSQQLLYSQTGV